MLEDLRGLMGQYVVFQLTIGEGDRRTSAVVGTVKEVDGRAVFSNSTLERMVTRRQVRHRRWPDRVLTPEDGELYLRALPQNFTDEHFFAMKVYEPEE